MKKHLAKFLALFVVAFILCTTFLSFSSSALSSTNGKVGYLLNGPSSVTFKNRNNTNAITLPIQTTVRTEPSSDEYNISYAGLSSEAYDILNYSYVGGLSTYNRYQSVNGIARSVSVVGGINSLIGAVVPSDGLYSNLTSFYPSTSLISTRDPSEDVPSVGSPNVQYAFKFGSMTLDFNNYYYDSSISHGNWFTLETYIVKAASTTPNPSGIANLHKVQIHIRYRSLADMSLIDHYVTVTPSVVSSQVIVGDDYDYYNVRLRYDYETAINNSIASIYGKSVPDKPFKIPSVSITFNTPPANILGVGGQGVSPAYALTLSSYVSDTEYLNNSTELTLVRNNVVESSSWFSWLTSAIGGFFNVELFGFVSLGDIFAVTVGVSLVMLILKIFAGG